MKKYKSALLIGRFQPFHLGHLYLIKEALKNAETLVIGIGSANITDGNNPLDYETRSKVLEAVAYKEKFTDKIIKIVPLDDFYDDQLWLRNVLKKAGVFDLVVGNNDWVNGIMEKAGFKILREPYFKRYLYEGWRIRKLVEEGKKGWENRVPTYLRNFLTSYFKSQGIYYENVVLGGTFDHFHAGHRALIDRAIEIGKNVTIGIAQGALLDKKILNNLIEPLALRKKNVKNHVAATSKLKIIEFSDIYGQTLTDKNIDAIVVSNMTLANAIKINIEREKIGFKQMQIVVVDNIIDEKGQVISSERIRLGEIDREGKVFQVSDLLMPETLRKTLQKPLGTVVNGKEHELQETARRVIGAINKLKKTIVVAVGDIVSTSLEAEGFFPDLKIIDNRSRRKKIVKKKLLITPIINKPGTISSRASEKIRESVNTFIKTGKKQTIIIKGEEDLLALPAIVFAPLNSVVLYGDWKRGIVIVKVTEQKKSDVLVILDKFIQRNSRSKRLLKS